MKHARHTAAGWAQLLRLPNLFTVPGDVLAGALLAAAASHLAIDHRLILAILASFALYACGLILNDLADFKVDQGERPQRPLPAGRVPIPGAIAAAILSGVFGLGLAWFCGLRTLAVAAPLLALIVVYNFAAKKNRLAGALAMGGCRALNLGLGASLFAVSASTVYTVLPAALIVGGYIAAVTYIAAVETANRPVGPIRWLPASAGLIALGLALHVRVWPAVLIALIATAVQARIGRAAGRADADQPRQVGRWIRGLIGLQAAFCAIVPGPGHVAAAILLLVLWPAGRLTGKKFYGS